MAASAMDVGGRVLDKNGFRGTVRFVGDLSGAQGEWVGVEWDDPTRGKHNGCHGDVRYFTCQNPTSGSFARGSALTAGASFLEVMRRRYIDEVGDKVEEMELGDGVAVSAFGQEMNTEKAADLSGVGEAHLRGTEVCRCGDSDALAALAPNFIKLANLSSTLLTQWQEVADIAGCLPRLRRLELSDNRLVLPPQPAALAGSFSRVTTVFLNRTGVAWDQIRCLSTMLPALEELHLCQNSITHLHSADDPLDSPVQGFDNLRLFNLELNSVTSWSEVMRLSRLPRLEALILTDNSLTEVHRLPEDADPPLFPSLASLSLNGNKISEWSSVDSLSSYQQLKELRIKDIPLLAVEKMADGRQLIIARVAGLQSLHGSEVSAKERQFAEQDYVKRYFPEFVRFGGSADSPSVVAGAFVDQHSSFVHLLAKHGAPLSTAPAPKSQILALSVEFPDEPGFAKRTVSLPNSVPLKTLKGMIRRLFRVKSPHLHLTYIRSEGDAEREMDDDMRPLSYFALAAGNIILVRLS